MIAIQYRLKRKQDYEHQAVAIKGFHTISTLKTNRMLYP